MNSRYYNNHCHAEEAYIHSLNIGEKRSTKADVVTITGEMTASGEHIALYKGHKCTAIYNPMVNRWYVDDVYGVID